MQSLLFYGFGYFVGQFGGGGAGARAIDKAERGIEADLFDQFHGGREIILGLSGEADDEVGR